MFQERRVLYAAMERKMESGSLNLNSIYFTEQCGTAHRALHTCAICFLGVPSSLVDEYYAASGNNAKKCLGLDYSIHHVLALIMSQQTPLHTSTCARHTKCKLLRFEFLKKFLLSDELSRRLD